MSEMSFKLESLQIPQPFFVTRSTAFFLHAGETLSIKFSLLLYKQAYYEHKLQYLINCNFENYIQFSGLRSSMFWYIHTNISKDPVNVSFSVQE
jgi:hypothetical protein